MLACLPACCTRSTRVRTDVLSVSLSRMDDIFVRDLFPVLSLVLVFSGNGTRVELNSLSDVLFLPMSILD